MRAIGKTFATLIAAGAALVMAGSSYAQDRVRVGVFPVASSLPLFVAIDQGYFTEENLDIETIRLIGGPPNIAALIQNQIDVAAVLVTIEGMNANLRKDGVAMYISVNSQNEQYKMEQFVVRPDLGITSLAELRGKRIMSAPGPANVQMARAALAAVGLNDGDYQLDQLDMGQHVNAMTARTFDAGYTLEPNASVMRQNGVAETLEAGVIARYVLGDPNANAWVGGGAMSSDFINARPDVARRFTAAWERAINLINENPDEARKSLAKNTFTPDDLVDTIPLVKFTMVSDLTPENIDEFQRFIDFATEQSILDQRVDVTKYLKSF